MKRFLLCWTLLLAVLPAQAQLIRQFGVKAGITSAGQKITGGLAHLDLRRTGFTVAGFVEWLDMPVFSILTQLEYTQRGSGEEFVLTGPAGPEPIGTKEFYGRVDYLSIPVLAKVRFDLGPVTPYALAGPRMDFKVGHDSDEGVYDTLLEQFRKNTVGGTIGAGVEVGAILPVTLLAEFRYNLDFKDSFENQLTRIRNTAWDVWVGVGF